MRGCVQGNPTGIAGIRFPLQREIACITDGNRFCKLITRVQCPKIKRGGCHIELGLLLLVLWNDLQLDCNLRGSAVVRIDCERGRIAP